MSAVTNGVSTRPGTRLIYGLAWQAPLRTRLTSRLHPGLVEHIDVRAQSLNRCDRRPGLVLATTGRSNQSERLSGPDSSTSLQRDRVVAVLSRVAKLRGVPRRLALEAS